MVSTAERQLTYTVEEEHGFNTEGSGGEGSFNTESGDGEDGFRL